MHFQPIRRPKYKNFPVGMPADSSKRLDQDLDFIPPLMVATFRGHARGFLGSALAPLFSRNLRRRHTLRDRLHRKFQPGLRFQLGLWNRAGNFSPVKQAEKPHVISFKFQPGRNMNLGMCTSLVVHKKACKTLSCKFSRSILTLHPG